MINIGMKNATTKRTDRLCCQISFECFVADMKCQWGKGIIRQGFTSLHDRHWCRRQTLLDSLSLEGAGEKANKKTDK